MKDLGLSGHHNEPSRFGSSSLKHPPGMCLSLGPPPRHLSIPPQPIIYQHLESLPLGFGRHPHPSARLSSTPQKTPVFEVAITPANRWAYGLALGAFRYLPFPPLRQKIEAQIIFRTSTHRPPPPISPNYTLKPWLHGRMKEVSFLNPKTNITHYGWYFPATDPKKPVILFCNGRSAPLSRTIRLKPLLDEGYGLLGFEYPGYGRTPGNTTAQGLIDAAQGASEYLSQGLGIPARQQVLMGYSMGGGVATALAAENRHKALVLLDTFLSAPALLEDFGSALGLPKSLLPKANVFEQPFDNGKTLEKVHIPTLILWANQDEKIPNRHGPMLFQHAKSPHKAIACDLGASHNFRGPWVSHQVDGFLQGLPLALA